MGPGTSVTNPEINWQLSLSYQSSTPIHNNNARSPIVYCPLFGACLLVAVFAVWLSCSNNAKTVAIGALEGHQCPDRLLTYACICTPSTGNRNLSNYDPEINWQLSISRQSSRPMIYDNVRTSDMPLGQCRPSQHHDVTPMYCTTIITCRLDLSSLVVLCHDAIF